jgi:hypothetical protein
MLVAFYGREGKTGRSVGRGCACPEKHGGADVYGWKLRPGVAVKSITLETLSPEVIIGLMGVSMMNPQSTRN